MTANKTLEVLGMKESKTVDFESYSSAELLYVLNDLTKEIVERDKKLTAIQSGLDKTISTIYHEIELSLDQTNTSKLKRYEGVQDALRARRKVKQDLVILRQLNGRFKGTAEQVHNKVSEYIQILTGEREKPLHMQNKINHTVPNYKQGEIKRLFTKYSKGGN